MGADHWEPDCTSKLPKNRRLSLLQLNRALLARQNLLERTTEPPINVVHRSVGLQAQGNEPPYVALWSRVGGFEKRHLEHTLRERQLVRASLLRSTLHIAGPDDFTSFWPVIRPTLQRTFRSNFKDVAKTLDVEALTARTIEFLSTEAKSFPELRSHLSSFSPGYPPASLSWAARANLPLVQVPPAGEWKSHASPKYMLPHDWQAVVDEDTTEAGRELVLRYLATFGPASQPDITAWAGVSLSKAVKNLKCQLVTFEDDNGRQLLDIPGGPLPRSETEAPVRFLHSWDNVLLAHKQRERIIAGPDCRKVFLTVGRVLPTVLFDGFVAGTWSWSNDEEVPELQVQMFRPMTARQREAVVDEGTALLAFLSGERSNLNVVLE